MWSEKYFKLKLHTFICSSLCQQPPLVGNIQRECHVSVDRLTSMMQRWQRSSVQSKKIWKCLRGQKELQYILTVNVKLKIYFQR